MKKKILALTLAATLTLSSTSVFAATTCTKSNYDLNSLKNYICNLNSEKTNITNMTVNGKTVDLNSIDWKSILDSKSTCPTVTKQTVAKPSTAQSTTEKPAVTQTTAEKPAATQTTTEKPAATQTTAEKPAATQTTAEKPAATQTTAEKPAVTQTTAKKPVVTKTTAEKPAVTQATTEKPVATKQATPSNTEVSSSVSSYEQKVVELVNVERQKAGLSSLALDTAISNIARMKSKDMATNNYFAHQSPTYGSAGDMLTKYGIKWSAWGENIASGQRTPQEVVTAWMNSPGHKANIMSTNFSKLGVGYVVNSNGTPYWTQMFTN